MMFIIAIIIVLFAFIFIYHKIYSYGPSTKIGYLKNSHKWWERKRILYNFIILCALPVTYVAGCWLVNSSINSSRSNFGVTSIFLLIPIGVVILLMANVLYGIGYILDIRLNKNENESFSGRLFYIGIFGSVIVLLLAPFLVYVLIGLLNYAGLI